MIKILKVQIFVISYLLGYPLSSMSETISHDISNWNRIGILIEKDKIPLSLQIDGQLRFIKNISVYDSFQVRKFLNYKFNENNTFSIGYLFSTRTNSFSNVGAIQYTNKLNIINDLLNYEFRFRFEKRWLTDISTNTIDDFRGRFRIGFGYFIYKDLELILNNESFITDKLSFSENRMQTGLTYNLNKDISVNLLYQNRYLNSDITSDKIDHTIFSNFLYKIKL